MKQIDKKHFVSLMTAMSEIYGKKLSTEWLEIYWRSLESYDFNEIKQALNVYIVNTDNGQFIPKPADIIKILSGSSADKALFAWNKVLKAIRLVGSYSSIVFDDPVIHLVIDDMGGWILICKTNESELAFVKNDFEKRYKNYLKCRQAKYPKILIGLVDKFNQNNQLHLTKPELFGDKEIALRVYQEKYYQDKDAQHIESNQLLTKD